MRVTSASPSIFKRQDLEHFPEVNSLFPGPEMVKVEKLTPDPIKRIVVSLPIVESMVSVVL